MKIPEPKQLASGSWRIQIQVNGKRYSITDKNKKAVKNQAKLIFAGITIDDPTNMTVKEGFYSLLSFIILVIFTVGIMARQQQFFGR